MSDRGGTAKQRLFDGLTSVSRAFGSGRRAEIIDLLLQGEHSVEAVAAGIGQSLANTSHHLQVLASAGLVASRRQGQRVIYRPASVRVVELWLALRDVAASHVTGIEALTDAYTGSREGIEVVTADELAERIAGGRAVVIDVRPESEFRAGHIAGALSIPIDRLAEELGSLRGLTEVIAYCRGPYCVYADDAVRLLADNGIAARRLDVGYPEWVIAGHPVDRVAVG